MSANPMVSVIMPAYNSERFISEAMRSVFAQSFEDWELIVVNDCSTDSTLMVAEELAKEDERVFVISNDKNAGAAATRNRGIEKARGNYIALLDSDDRWEPEKLSMQLEQLAYTHSDISYCSYEIINDRGKKIAKDFIVPTATSFEDMLTQSVLSSSTVLISRSSLGDYRFPSQVYHEDLALWLDLLRNGCKAVGCQEVLASYRIVSGSRTSNKMMSAVHRWDLFRRYLNLPFLTCVKLLSRYGLLALRKYIPIREGDAA